MVKSPRFDSTLSHFTVESCTTLLSKDLKRNVFNLFASWSGPSAKRLGVIFHGAGNSNLVGCAAYASGTSIGAEEEKLQFGALQVTAARNDLNRTEELTIVDCIPSQAMCALLCCGPCFDSNYLAEEGVIYPWLDMLLTSKDDKVYNLAKDTVVLLLESNPDIGPLLEWVIDRCYTACAREADACFLALAAIFSAR